MNNNFQINFSLNPSFDISKFNVILSHLKKSLGEFGKDINLIDTKKINNEFDQLKKESSQAGNQVKETLKGVGVAAESSAKSAGMLQKAFAFNQIVQSVTFISQAISQLTQAGVDFEAGLAAVGAITGFTGEKLDVLGESARSLSVKFGGSANDQLKSFQGILSKLGPQIAEDAGALELLATNVNILSAASGDDAATSMQAITDAMLQLGLATGTPMEQAQNSTRVINALAASAQVGAAEIPQVAAALVQVGSTAKTFNMDVENVNAGLQVLAVGGKTGSEAGVAMRNVMLMLAAASGPAESAMKGLGSS